MLPSPEDRRGIALAVALFGLVIIGAVVSGSFFAGRLEQHSGQNTMFAAQALEAAEAGLSDVLANADLVALEALSAGRVPLELPPLTVTAGVTSNRQVVRLTSTLFLVRATGATLNADGTPLAVRSLGLLVQIAPASGAVPPHLIPLRERAWMHLY
jgi:hypothetical protein